MARVNEHYLKLKAGYLFPEIGRRVRAFAEANPSAKVIRLGIGDVTRPLPPAVVKALMYISSVHQLIFLVVISSPEPTSRVLMYTHESAT